MRTLALACAIAVTAGPASAALAAPLPDLTVTQVSASSNHIEQGAPVMVRGRFRNMGSRAGARAWWKAYLSPRRRWSRRAIELPGRGRVVPLPAGAAAASTLRTAVERTARPRSYYLIVCIDRPRRIRERDERNNCRTSRRAVEVRRASGSPVSAPAEPHPSPPRAGPASILKSGETLAAGEELASASGGYRLTMQDDGNLVLSEAAAARWSSGTHGNPGARAVMQSDGNLVIYAGDRALWNSETAGFDGSSLRLTDDGDLLVETGARIVWSRERGYEGDRLRDAVLTAGAQLLSRGREYRLIMQADGNLVLYRSAAAVWSTGTGGHADAYAAMQRDGNLVVYERGGAARWSSATAGFDGASLHLQDDGNAVIYHRGAPAWSSGGGYHGDTLAGSWRLEPGGYRLSANREYSLVMQHDGNLVLYRGGAALWSTRTGGQSGAHVVMQSDGNLVVYRDGAAVWSSGTAGNPGAFLATQDDGNLVIYRGATALWSRHGDGAPAAGILGPLARGSVSSPAASHHIVYGGDWSMDIAGTGDVHARFASGDVTLVVEHVGAACTAPASGGRKVRVRVTVGGSTIGTVTYSHLANVAVTEGNRYANGVWLGAVATGLPHNDQCWTGPHVHLEPRNDAGYACYVPLGEGAFVGPDTTIGRIGAVGADRVRQPCS